MIQNQVANMEMEPIPAPAPPPAAEAPAAEAAESAETKAEEAGGNGNNSSSNNNNNGDDGGCCGLDRKAMKYVVPTVIVFAAIIVGSFVLGYSFVNTDKCLPHRFPNGTSYFALSNGTRCKPKDPGTYSLEFLNNSLLNKNKNNDPDVNNDRMKRETEGEFFDAKPKTPFPYRVVQSEEGKYYRRNKDLNRTIPHKATVKVVIDDKNYVVKTGFSPRLQGQLDEEKDSALALRQEARDFAIKLFEEACKIKGINGSLGNNYKYFFRVESGEKGCGEVVKCLEAVNGWQPAFVKCPADLRFDLQEQTCQYPHLVHDCDKYFKIQGPLPNLYSTKCGEGEIECGSKECMAKEYFCDGSFNCNDGSDERICSLEENPNRAPVCDKEKCELPDCLCSANGTEIPVEGMAAAEVPQMVLLSFSGAVTEDLLHVFDDVLKLSRRNPNGCSVKATFFVSHSFTSYYHVQKLHQIDGHEMAAFGVTTGSEKATEKYWSKGSENTWLDEMDGQRRLLETFADTYDVTGMRAPQLKSGGVQQFSAMVNSGFEYDASLVVPLRDVPSWPYTLDYRVPHLCHNNGESCPHRSYPGVWSLPINELDKRNSTEKPESLTGCALIASCALDPGHFKFMLKSNLERHYHSNKAPFSLSLDASFLNANPKILAALVSWIDEVLSSFSDVYFVTHKQALEWLRAPIPSADIQTDSSGSSLPGWRHTCEPDESAQLPCGEEPNRCGLLLDSDQKGLFKLVTCSECPAHYPWLGDITGGNGGGPGGEPPIDDRF